VEPQPDPGVWDVVVVGAGPAGSAAALAALRTRPGARVLLLDRSDFPRDKSCGDGIAPQALDELRLLGADDVLADRVPVHVLRVRAPDGVEVGPRLRRPTTSCRARCSTPGWSRPPSPAARCCAATPSAASRSGPDRVVLDGEIAARWSSAPTGPTASYDAARRPRQPDDCLAVAVRGLRARRHRPGEPEQAIVMDRRDWPAYAWSFDAGDGTRNVGFGMLLPRLRASARGGQGRAARAAARAAAGRRGRAPGQPPPAAVDVAARAGARARAAGR
jgi:flavin-dependent dehydrogenase